MPASSPTPGPRPPRRSGLLWRAGLALLLPVGFYLLALGVVAAALGVDVLLVEDSSAPLDLGALKIYAGSFLIVFPVLRALVLAHRQGDRPEINGLPLSPAEQPELWARVTRLAERTGTRPPADIWLTAEVNAAVDERTRLLGLLPGRRTLIIGAPLLIGLTERELDSVLAHEFGHYSHHDTRLGGLIHGGRQTVLRTATALNERADRRQAEHQAQLDALAAARRAKGRKARRPRALGGVDRQLGRLFAGYACLYVRLTDHLSRRQETAADLAAAHLAGRDATASALRRLVALDLAFQIHLREYATIGWPAGLLPPPGEVYGGLSRLLGDPERQRTLAAVPLPDRADPHDSHPPLAARVAVIEALPPDGLGPDRSAPAVALLMRPQQTLAALEQATLVPEPARMHRLDWPELVRQTGRARYAAGARGLLDALQLGSAVLTLDRVLDLATTGRLRQLAERLPLSPAAAAATGRAAHEFRRGTLRSALRDLTLLALAETGAIDWELTWSRPVRQLRPEGLDEALPPALDAAVADLPDPTPLRALATHYGASPPHHAPAPSIADGTR